MDERVIAQKAPFKVEVEAGKTYWWCACGRSAAQPFCDGSHKGTALTPLQWVADAPARSGSAAASGPARSRPATAAQGAVRMIRLRAPLATVVLASRRLQRRRQPPPPPLCPRGRDHQRPRELRAAGDRRHGRARLPRGHGERRRRVPRRGRRPRGRDRDRPRRAAGPGDAGGTLELPYFVAVSAPDGEVIDRQDFVGRVTVPGRRPPRRRDRDLQPAFRRPRRGRAGYQVLFGFALPEDEALRQYRRGGRLRPAGPCDGPASVRRARSPAEPDRARGVGRRRRPRWARRSPLLPGVPRRARSAGISARQSPPGPARPGRSRTGRASRRGARGQPGQDRRGDRRRVRPPAHAATVTWVCSPRPSMPSRMVWPGRRYTGGFWPMPTPGGVPVEITSPGCRLMNWDR